ncbi:HlyD family efflux transporter periplasmic adaptor subunit [Sulfuricurvum sp. IAE1]|uniref:HlyD family secretion protein n=1 Tax=Sulfuricurvum sp. IAE1 TaxID=2546102 RepID=UPI00104DA88F|nr:HlyD family efflux transporter periplasmic adaptor subunit [Sulfuricurvum sp. IAE1]MDD3770000.1 HlyD family efflux transporter periplasmic adaptor subunit [Sulfuricurvum sp.]TDA63115.1 HlyD family efflux transporter periplasmic adaptor subunit [Sulfuricurvum sp. IAE1]
MFSTLKKYWLGALIALLFGTGAVLIYVRLHPPQLAENLIQGTGRIDGDLINLNAKYAGRISRIDVEEGEQVRRFQTVAVIDSQESRAQHDQVVARLDAARREFRSREIELEILRRTLPQTLLKADANLALSQRSRDELDRTVSMQKNIVAQSEKDFERMHDLVGKRLVESRQLETAELKLKTDREQLSALMYKRKQLDETISIAQSSRVEALLAQRKIDAMQEANNALSAGIKAMEATQAQSQAVLDEMELRSPVNGFVVERIAHGGEVVGAGNPVVTLIDPSSLYLKIFVDTLQNGKIKIADRAVIFVDAYPDHPIAAKVVRIEQKAEFTPKEVSVASDRIQRVYAVHLKPLKPDPLLKLGLPAVGVVSLDGKNLPVTLREVPE